MSLHKIHTRIVIDSMTGKVEEDEFYWHDTDKDGPISQLGGGGGGGDGDGDIAAEDVAMAESFGAGSADESGEGGWGMEAPGASRGGAGGAAGGAASVADFAGPGPAAPGPASAPGGAPTGGHHDEGRMDEDDIAEAGDAGRAAAAATAASAVAGAPALGSGYVDPFPGLIDPTWSDDPAFHGGWDAMWHGTYEEDDGIDGGSDRPEDDDTTGTGTPAPGGPGGPGGPGVVGGPGSIIPPWWSGSPHAEYTWGRYGTPYAIPSPRWESGYDVPGHLTGYMPHYEGLLKNAYTYPDIKALGLIYGAPPPAPAAEEEDDDDGEEEESGGGETE